MGKLTRALLLFAAAAAAHGQWYGGGGKRYDKVSWGLCVGTSCAVAANITVPYIAVWKAKFEKCFVAAKTAPAGAALIFDVKLNGVSIFGGGPKLQLADGATTGSTTTFASTAVAEGGQITIDIVQVGSTTPGKDVSVVCRLGL